MTPNQETSYAYGIDLSIVKPAYLLLDEMRKQMPHKFFIELLAHYISEEDSRREEVYDLIMKYAEIDGVVLKSNSPIGGTNPQQQQ
jgi:hypothetical protein